MHPSRFTNGFHTYQVYKSGLFICLKYIQMPVFNLFSKSSTYTTYPDPISEEVYWLSALSGQRKLSSSNAHTRCRNAPNGLLGYYVPALLPAYRCDRDTKSVTRRRADGRRVYISPRMFREWLRMVFPDSVGFIRFNILHADETQTS